MILSFSLVTNSRTKSRFLLWDMDCEFLSPTDLMGRVCARHLADVIARRQVDGPRDGGQFARRLMAFSRSA
jgi:hypothetical protein